MTTRTRKSRATLAAGGLLGLLAAPSAFALPILEGSYNFATGNWEASDSEGRTATARFASYSSGGVSGIQITLTNLAMDPNIVPNEVLVGLTFDYAGTIADPSTDAYAQNTVGSIRPSTGEVAFMGTNLDGEVAFRNDLGDYEDMGQYTVSSSAFDPLGINPVINPAFNFGTPSTNGASFGIVNGSYGSTNVSFPSSISYWVEDSLVIRLALASGTFNAERVTNVNFLYGTDYYVSVPEPGMLSLLGAGLLAAGLASRRRRKAIDA